MGSPWDGYRKVLDVEHLDNSITVAERKAPHSGLVAIKAFPSATAEKALERHQRAKHEKIVDVLDAFTTDTFLYIVLEHLPISLLQIVEGAKYPNELQLAAILKQVRLLMSGAVHSLTQHARSSAALSISNTRSSNMDLSTAQLSSSALGATSKLVSRSCPNSQPQLTRPANLQCCETVDGKGEPRDVRALSSIMMELMQKYVKDDGAVGVDNLHRWPSDCDAVAFLSETTSAASALELQNVCGSLSSMTKG